MDAVLRQRLDPAEVVLSRPRLVARGAVTALTVFTLAACDSASPPATSAAPTAASPAAVAGRPPGTLVIGVIGDYGSCSTDCGDEQRVADLVHGWSPSTIISVGDNAYGDPSRTAADILPYAADLAAGRLLPAIGNEDDGDGCGPSPIDIRLRVLRHPRHFTATLGTGLVDLFVNDTECGDPDGNTAGSAQASRLRAAVAASPARWRISVGHRSPYSSGPSHGTPSVAWIAPPGVDLVLSGHDHAFEDVLVDGRHYVIDGAGGHGLNPQCQPACAAGSVWHDDTHFGAVRLTVTSTRLLVEYVAVGGLVLHSFALTR
jgi:hypothetical protein